MLGEEFLHPLKAAYRTSPTFVHLVLLLENVNFVATPLDFVPMQCTYTDTQSSLRHATPDFLARSTGFRDAAQHFRVLCATADAVRPDVGSAELRIRRERM